MTGFASGQKNPPEDPKRRASEKNDTGRIAIELRSVNNRFLDLSFRLPEELRSQEPTLRELLGKRLKRGKVEFRATLEDRETPTLSDPPAALLQRLASLQDKVRVWLPDAPALPVADVLRLAANATPSSDADHTDALLPLARSVLDDFIAARAREGARLAKLLHERIAALRQLATQAAPLVPQAVEAQKQRFLARWNEAAAGSDGQISEAAAQERALAEVTAYAIRIDVAEELERLNAHLDEIESVLSKGGEIGKRLDFLIQELHREANTLGSKSTALELSRIGVDMKVLIEQMREQVQNIE